MYSSELNDCNKEVYDIAKEIEREYLNYRSIWNLGQHFGRHVVDVNMKTCDSYFVIRVNASNDLTGHVLGGVNVLKI